MQVIYSRLIYIEHIPKEAFYIELIQEWCEGTKLYIYTPRQQVVEKLQQVLTDKIQRLGLSQNDSFYRGGDISKNLFHCTIGKTQCYLGKELDILNGENRELYQDILIQLDQSTTFNLNQYEVEHAQITDIILKAGAGTGKTYSMIARIQYLIWKRQIQPEVLREAIVMITFTNEAANAMREKLKMYFLNCYYLTQNTRCFQYLDAVNDMNISTIDSLAKKIIKKYSYELGLGIDFRIITNYQKKRMLHQKLNDFISKDNYANKVSELLDIPLYELEERLVRLVEGMGNKKIDLLDSKVSYYDLTEKNDFKVKIITEVIKETQEAFKQWSIENNVIALSDLITKVVELVKYHKSRLQELNQDIQFVFIDEFQDTDDVQIELVSEMKRILDFKLFVVGDIKQCIYRFRGAEEDAFDKLNEHISCDQVRYLNKNYRTDKSILEKYNKIFSEWGKKGYLIYNQNQSTQDTLIGTREINDGLEIYGYKYNVPDPQHWRNKQDQKKDEKKTLLPQLVKECIKDIEINQNGKGTIALLVRYNAQIKEVKALCEREGINVETPIGGELFKVEPTIDLLKLVLALKNSMDTQYLYNLFTTAYASEVWYKEFIFNQLDQEEVLDYFYQHPALPRWSKYLKALRTEPVLKVLKDIIEETKPWQEYAKKKVMELECSFEDYQNEYIYFEVFYKSNLEKLLETIVQESKVDYLTLNTIVNYLEIMIMTKQEKEARMQHTSEDKIRVICTTVHRAKGLEYDTVILPFADLDISGSVNKGEADLIYKDQKLGYRIKKGNQKDYSSGHIENNYYKAFKGDENKDRTNEEARILYVAMTRAIRKVIYLYDEKKNQKKKQAVVWKDMIKGDI